VDPDLVIIGGGAAALAAARTARRRGATVTVVSEGPLGGDCTWVGCIPSKTLLAAAAAGMSFGAAMDRVRATVHAVAATEDADTLRREGIDVVAGRARLTGPRGVTVDGRRLSCRRLILATGGGPRLPPIAGIEDAAPLTNENVWELTDRPRSLVTIGGGPLGVELSLAFAHLGTTVTVVEATNRLLPAEEPRAAKVVTRVLEGDGLTVRTGDAVTGLRRTSTGLEVGVGQGRAIVADAVLVAAGRQARTADLGLEAAGVALDAEGYIRTDRYLRTTVPTVWAAGDVTGRAPWTHGADEMGRVAATNALTRRPWRRFHDERMPSVTYTSPEVARIGLTEATAATAAPGARVVELELTDLDRAVTAQRTDGFIKLITAPRQLTRNVAGGRLIGATIVADRAGDMISVPTLAVATGMFPARLALTAQAYPTWALGVRQAAAKLFTGDSRPARPS
jgi:pyruvate/2-oxoglutarate dehydrogenase complex dihydrolipoamide dehydrogenase (E3) component